MTRSNTDPLYELDPEFELTLHRLRKARKIVVNNSSSSDSIINSNQFFINIFASSSNIFAEPSQMENNDRTLEELATPNVILLPRPPPHLILTHTQDNSKAHLRPEGEMKSWFFWPRLQVKTVISRELRKNAEYTINTHAKLLKKKEDGKNVSHHYCKAQILTR
ncbi:hypothetical protein CR513_31667, partial [Mucuna pruriens]